VFNHIFVVNNENGEFYLLDKKLKQLRNGQARAANIFSFLRSSTRR